MALSAADLYSKYEACGYTVSTDTRSIAPGSLFVALKGANFNGNRFAADALAKGARFAVVDEAEFVLDERYLLVNDGLKALQQLAHHHRKQLNIPVIGVGGSNGKTTTKELIAKVLSKQFKVFATKGNFNNHIGVPLSLLSITPGTELAVIEMGANGPGEIAELCEIAAPTHGIITNIGLDHLEGFGSIEGVAQANSELYYYLLRHQGTAFVNTLEEHLSRMASRFPSYVSYPQAGNDYHCELLGAGLFVRIKAENGDEVQTQIIGAYNFNNIATALCIGKHFGVPASAANDAVAEYVPSNNRSQLVKTQHNTIILDAYNANPSSMEVAIENLAQMDVKTKVLILGDMFELGKDSATEHQRLGANIALKGPLFEQVFLCGQEMAAASAACPTAHHFETRAALADYLAGQAPKDAYILIKGSRGMSLEKLVDLL